MGDMINLQVGKQTPYSRDEIISAHKIMYSEREGYTKVMLAIVQRSIVNERIEELKNAGISVGRVMISSEGVYNWFNLLYSPDLKIKPDDTIAILDVDSNYSDFITIHAGKLAFTKNIFIGANHLKESSQPWKDKLIEELERCLKRYYIEERNTKIEKIFLTGTAQNIDDLGLILSNALAVQADKIDMSKKITIRKDPKMPPSESVSSVSLTPLVGAVLKNITPELDLTPGEHKILKLMEKKRKDLTVMGILFLSIVMIMSFFLFISFYYKSAYLAQLKKQVKEISSESGDIEKMRLSIELVKRSLDAKNSALSIMHEIYSVTPSEISLTSIDIDENKQVVLKGRGFVMSDVFKFIKKLEESKLFESVKASYTRTKREKVGDSDVEYAEFELVCPYEER
jgi:hypothetical protein